MTDVLSRRRLVTLVGEGGAGKTRLARRVEESTRTRFTDGTWLVDLAGTRGVSLAEVVAATLDLRALPGCSVEESLVAGIGERSVLLVLDGCEHVLEEAARLALALLVGCPRVVLLATSRAALGLREESVYRVGGLLTPGQDVDPSPDALARFDAVRLFVDRLSAGNPGFTLDETSAASVAEVCRTLDGVPLAIEIAAGRAKALSLEQVATTLRPRVSDPSAWNLDRLFDWSYDHLDAVQRATLRASSVFVGGWTLPALTSVLDRVLPENGNHQTGTVLDSLVRSALVVRQEGRHRLLDTIQYAVRARISLPEAATLQEAHARWYAAWARREAPALTSSNQIGAMRRFEEEGENLRAAQAHLVAVRDAEGAQRLVADLSLYRENRGLLSEGAERGLEALALGYSDASLPAMVGTGRLLLLRGDERALGLYQDALDLSRRRGDAQAEADAEQGLGNVVFWQRDIRTAEAHYLEAYALRQEANDPAGIASSLHSLGNVRLRDGRLAEAKALFEEALAIRRELGDARGLTMTLGAISQTALAQDEYDEAARLTRETVGQFAGLRIRWALALCLSILARVAEHRGDLRRAALLAGTRARVREITGFPVPAAERSDLEAALADLRERCGGAAFDEAYGEGYSKDWNDAVALAAE